MPAPLFLRKRLINRNFSPSSIEQVPQYIDRSIHFFAVGTLPIIVIFPLLMQWNQNATITLWTYVDSPFHNRFKKVLSNSICAPYKNPDMSGKSFHRPITHATPTDTTIATGWCAM